MGNVIKINPDRIELDKIKFAANIIKSGGIVAFPTETVYGLGADLFNQEAVRKIFQVKNRPLDTPLIAHICNLEQLKLIAMKIDKKARKLIEKFWPGPLTLIFKKSNVVPDIVTAGRDTIAARMPDNEIALKFIKYSGTPIAAPSANIYNKPSPTNAKEVINYFGKRVDLIIDGGKTRTGIPSTIIDITGETPVCLRQGSVDIGTIEKLVGGVRS